MRQQLKEETDEREVTRQSSTATSEQTVAHVITNTTHNTSKWQGWPFIAVGMVLIVAASLTFAIGMDFLRTPIEIEQDIEKTIGTNTTSSFFFSLSIFAFQLGVTFIYILYGLWLRKHGKGGPLPAYLNFWRKKLEKSGDPIRQSIARTLRLFACFLALISMWGQLTPFEFRYGSSVSAQTIILAVCGALSAMGISGLMLIEAEAICPLRGPKARDKVAASEDQ